MGGFCDFSRRCDRPYRCDLVSFLGASQSLHRSAVWSSIRGICVVLGAYWNFPARVQLNYLCFVRVRHDGKVIDLAYRLDDDFQGI